MKINLEIDCTPEEARRFLGLPDLEPLQAAVMARLQQQMLDAVTALSPESLLRQWVPLMPQTPERMREAMAAMMGAFVPPQGSAPGGAPGGRAKPE